MRNSSIKVMHGRGGKVRIIEESADAVKVYSLQEWNDKQKVDKLDIPEATTLPDLPTVEELEETIVEAVEEATEDKPKKKNRRTLKK